jgi:spoIIIJ-associated protein
VKDRVFEGDDVRAALNQAAAATGLAAAALRYVVLEPGSPAGPGTPAHPARIAVLLQGGDASVGGAAPRETHSREAEPATAAEGPEALHALIAALARASGLPLAARIEAGPETTVVRLEGADAFLLEDDAEVLQALEHLLQRALGERFGGGRLVLDATGYRAAREARLAGQARAWAEEVRRSGRARELPPMNAYDRRLVHLAMAGEPGVRSFSVGEGSRRRVTIAPALEAP